MLFSVEEYNPNLHNKQGFVWLDILNYYTFMVKKKKVAINLHIKDKQGSDKKKKCIQLPLLEKKTFPLVKYMAHKINPIT